MKVKDVEERLAEIVSSEKKHNYDVIHLMEDSLMEDVLQSIANNTCDDAQKLAKVCIDGIKEMDF